MSAAKDEFEDLFRGEFARLSHALSSFGEGAEEAVQEAFVKALVRWGHVRGCASPVAWIRTVAVRDLLNRQRSERRQRIAQARLARDHVESQDGASLDVRRAVGALPPQQRIVVAMRYGGAYSVAEIAEAMKLSDGTVKYHLHVARERLRTVLAEDAHD
jgi:RNA polymerase sigma factor (sigma-70 family)